MPEIRQVAVIGAGRLGRSLAILAAGSGYPTILEDVLPSHLRDARAAAIEAAGGGTGSMLPRSLTFAGSLEEAVRDADLILDSVPDELESKLEIFSLLDRMAPPRSIFLTPTREQSIADLASCTFRPERCVAFLAPEPLVAVPAKQAATLAVVHTSQTNAAVLQAVLQFWSTLGFSPAPQTDPKEAALETGSSKRPRSKPA